MEKRLTSEKQLEALLEKDGHVTVFLFQNKIPTLIEIAKSKSSHSFGCFTNVLPHRSYGCTIAHEDISSDKFNEYRTKFSYLIYFNSLRELLSMTCQEYGIIMPSNFDEEYHKFISNNKKSIFQVISKYCGTPNNDICKYIFSLTNSSNYFVWAIKLVVSQCVSTSVIKTIMTWVKNHQDLLKLLSRHTITAYTSSNSLCELSTEFMRLRALKRANVTINEFNTNQKKLLKNEIANNNLTKLQLKTLDEFSKLSDAKRRNFVRKVSTIEDVVEIFRLMELLVSTKFSWDKPSVKEFIEVGGLNSKIIYESDNVLVCEVMDYEAIKKMAKTTNWCIAKNRRYWQQYINTDEAKQYIVFNFNEKEDGEMSIVGFTSVTNIGITNAHSFTNINLIQNSETTISRRLFFHTPIIPNKVVNGIYSFLDKCNVPLELVIRYSTSFSDWKEEYVLNEIKRKIDECDYDIIQNANGKVVIKVNWECLLDGRFREIVKINSNFINGINSPKYALVFFDFTKNISDLEKVYFAIVEGYSKYDIESCNTVFTEFLPSKKTFNELLSEYGLPKTIIKRVDSVSSRLIETLSFGDYSEFLKLIKSDDGIKEFKKLVKTNSNFKEQAILPFLNCIDCFSFDFAKTIYDCGESVSTIFGDNALNEMVIRLFYKFRDYFNDKPIYLDKMMPLVMDGSINNRHLAQSIVSYYMFYSAFKHEANKELFVSIVIDLLYNGAVSQNFANVVIDTIIDSVDLSKWDSNIRKLFTVICNYDCQDALKKVLNAKLGKSAISFIVSRLHYDSPMLNCAAERKKEIVGS